MLKIKKDKEVVNLKQILELFKLNKKFLIIFVCIIELVVIVSTFILPYEYEAASTTLPQKQESGGSLSNFLQSVAGGITLGGSVGGTQSQVMAEVLRSRSVAKLITESLKLYNKPQFKDIPKEDIIDLIRNSIIVEVERSGLITVRVSIKTEWFPNSSDKDTAKILVANLSNSAIRSLDKIIRGKNILNSHNSRLYIETQLEHYRKNLDSLDEIIESFQLDNKVLALDEQTKSIIAQGAYLASNVIKTEIELTLAKQEYESDSPIIKAFQQSIQTLRNQLTKVQSGSLFGSDAVSLPLIQVPKLYRLYANLIRDKKILEQVTLYLETQKHQEAIQEEKDIPLIEPLDEAVPPKRQVSPSKKLMVILGFIISAFFGCLTVFSYALIKGSLYLRKDVVINPIRD
ncbi:MAG: uncharacterized protein HW421_1441 [Ignavibacteria bacterium]|nr:uncharacterized protein [Ignavibacteria bacterium]